jgi:6-pyruvoyl-tetrahydropterin synthase
MTTLFVNRLTVIDSAFLCPQRGLVGDSWQVDIGLDGALDEQGMVLDFGEVKRAIKRRIDETFDHRLLLPAERPELTIEQTGADVRVECRLEAGGRIVHESPASAIQALPVERIDPDTLTPLVVDAVRTALPDSVSGVSLRLWPETITGAFYHYSHGLRQHAGNCQRIAHGHRSRIQIWRNGERDEALEADWAAHWRDVYIGTRGDLCGSETFDGIEHWHFAYDGSQGTFGLMLPRSACYLVDKDSTVENIARHIAARLAETHPHDGFRVCAYEGVDKGAIAEV